jgi:hypothetical protein
MRFSIGIIGDLCEVYKGHMKPILNVELIKRLISKMKNKNDYKLKAFLQWVEEVIHTAMK